MSHWASAWAWEQQIENGGAKFVLVALAEFADEGALAYPSQATLANMTGQAERTVRAHLVYLEEKGLIKRTGRWRPDGTRTSDLFQLSGGFKPAAKSAAYNRQDSARLPAKSAASPPAESASDPVREKELSVELKYNLEFQTFYDNYPNRQAPPAAFKAWKAQRLRPEDVPMLLADVEKRYRGVEKRFIPHPATYLNQRRWEGDLIERPEDTRDRELMALRDQELAIYGEPNA